MLIQNFAKLTNPPTSSEKRKVRERIQKKLDSFAQSSALSGGARAASVMAGFRGLPDFVYPTIVGATPAEKAVVLQTLDALPLHHAALAGTIQVRTDVHRPFRSNEFLGGYASDLGVTSYIVVGRHANQGVPDVLRHEVGHLVDFDGPAPGTRSERPFGHGNFHTEYAQTSHREDFADSYKDVHGDPTELHRVAPEKAAYLEESTRPTFLQKLVDRQEFRDTGKVIADLAQGNAPVRHTADVVSALSGVAQLGYGLSQWMSSPSVRAPMVHASGILGTASGLAMLTGCPLVGLGLQGAEQALSSRVARGSLKGEEVESTVSFPLRPLEKALGVEGPAVSSGHRVGKVLAVGTGGAVGGVAGALAGPYLGVLLGHRVAGGVGGAIGFAVGAVGGFLGGAHVGGRVADALS